MITIDPPLHRAPRQRTSVNCELCGPRIWSLINDAAISGKYMIYNHAAPGLVVPRKQTREGIAERKAPSVLSAPCGGANISGLHL